MKARTENAAEREAVARGAVLPRRKDEIEQHDHSTGMARCRRCQDPGTSQTGRLISLSEKAAARDAEQKQRT